MLIEKATDFKGFLKGKTVLITGAGGGIGFEASRALAWMGANVVIAEIDAQKAGAAAQCINGELGEDRVLAYPIDIADDKQVETLYHNLKERFGFVDVVFNNATIAPLGAVDDVSITAWDQSYAVNLRGPVMLVQKFLPDMKKRNQGTIVFVPSSGAAPFMGAYETFKTAQVEVCNTLAAELEDTDINVFSIGPGLVRTQTAQDAIRLVAARMNMTLDAFYEMNAKHILDAEYAGVGFAMAVAKAQDYNGQEISSIQVLLSADLIQQEQTQGPAEISDAGLQKLIPLVADVVRTFQEQYQGWLGRNVFERQWVLRDFKKQVRLAADEFKFVLESTLPLAENNETAALAQKKDLFIRLLGYYDHQFKLMQGFEKDAGKLEENSRIIQGWIDEVRRVIDLL